MNILDAGTYQTRKMTNDTFYIITKNVMSPGNTVHLSF